MKNHSDTARNNGSHAQTMDHPEGYLPLATHASVFALDLIGENLRMNGIDVVQRYPDGTDDGEVPMIFVRTEQREAAISVLASLDLLDFITINEQ